MFCIPSIWVINHAWDQDGWTPAKPFLPRVHGLRWSQVDKHAEKERGQHPAILTSRLVNKGSIVWKSVILHDRCNEGCLGSGNHKMCWEWKPILVPKFMYHLTEFLIPNSENTITIEPKQSALAGSMSYPGLIPAHKTNLPNNAYDTCRDMTIMPNCPLLSAQSRGWEARIYIGKTVLFTCLASRYYRNCNLLLVLDNCRLGNLS